MGVDPDSIHSRAICYAYERGYRVNRSGRVVGSSGRVLKLTTRSRNGAVYYVFSIRLPRSMTGVERYSRKVDVHRLAAYQKFGDRVFEGDLETRHMNGSLDNRLRFIEIGTGSQNAFDRPESERCAHAKKAARLLRIFTNTEVRDMRGRSWRQSESLRSLCRDYLTSSGHMSNLVNGKLYLEAGGPTSGKRLR